MANAFGLKTSCCAITKTLTYVKYASTLCFACAPFLAPKSLRQIGEALVFFNELRKCARTSHVGGSFCIGNGVGIEVLAKPIFVRGLPLQWKRAPHRPVPPSLLRGALARHLNAPLACFLAYAKYASALCFACTPFLTPKSLRQIGSLWFFGTNSGSVYEPLM